MLRLAPSAVPLWRTPTSLQFGLDASVVLDEVRPWQERLIAALQGGVADAVAEVIAREAGASSEECRALLTQLRDVLEPPHPGLPSLAVSAPGIAADDLRRLAAALRNAGAHVVGDGAGDSAGADDSAGAGAGSGGGGSGEDGGGPVGVSGAGAPVLLVAAHLVEPRRAAALMAADRPHLALELGGDRVSVGPVVVPGLTACHACLHAHRADADPLWPVIASQALARRCDPTDPALLAEAGVWVMRLLSDPASAARRSVLLRRRGDAPMLREHVPHPACWCRSPGRIATPGVRNVRWSAPTTTTTSARPA